VSPLPCQLLSSSLLAASAAAAAAAALFARSDKRTQTRCDYTEGSIKNIQIVQFSANAKDKRF